MAKLNGVKLLAATIEVNGEQYEKVDRAAQVGDIVLITDEDVFGVDWITYGGFYSVVRVDSWGDPIIIDDEGDEIDASGWKFDVYVKVSVTPAAAQSLPDFLPLDYVIHDGQVYRKVERTASHGEKILFTRGNSSFDVGQIVTVHKDARITDEGIAYVDGRCGTYNGAKYVVLEPVDSVVIGGMEYALEKRSAKKGERVLITAQAPHFIRIGAICESVSDNGYEVFAKTAQFNDDRDLDDEQIGMRGGKNYVVLTPKSSASAAQSGVEYREVKRRAKVGERIRIVNSDDSFGQYGVGMEFVVKRIDYDGDAWFDKPEGGGEVFACDHEYVVLEPVTQSAATAQEKPRLKVGDYVKVVDDRGVDGDKRSEVSVGEIRRIIKDDRTEIPFRAELIDGSGSNWFREEALVLATDEEVDAAKRKLFAVGDKVRLINGGGRYPLNGFKNGGVYEVSDNDYRHDGVRKIEIRNASGWSGFAAPDQLRKLTEDELTERQRGQKSRPKVGDIARVIGNYSGHGAEIGDIVKVVEDDETSLPFRCTYADGTEIEDGDWFIPDELEVLSGDEAKWARIGRKVNEFKVGDLVRVTRSLAGHPVGTIGEVDFEDGTDVPRVKANGVTYWSGCELVVPVEQRFDKSE